MMLTKMMRVPRNHDGMLRSRNARARTTRSGAPSALSRRKRGGKSSRVSTPPSSIGMGGSKPKTTTGRRRDDSDDTEENPSGGETQTTRRTFVLLASASVASASETARADAKENNIFDEFPDEERNGDEASCGVKSLIVGPGFGEFESVSKALLASAEEGGATIEIKSGTYKERIIVNKKNVRLIGLSEDVALCAQHVVDLMHVEEVDAHAVLTEEDRLGGRLVRADPFGATLVSDLKEAGDVAATTGDIADLESDLAALGVFREVDECESTASDELCDAIGAYALANFETDHWKSRCLVWRRDLLAPLSSGIEASGIESLPCPRTGESGLWV